MESFRLFWETQVKTILPDLWECQKTFIAETLSILVPRWNPLDFTPAPVAFVNLFDCVLGRIRDFWQAALIIPAKLLAPVVIDRYFTTNPKLKQRVMTHADAYKFAASQIVEISLDMIQNFNFPTPALQAANRIKSDYSLANLIGQIGEKGLQESFEIFSKSKGKSILLALLPVLICVIGALFVVMLILHLQARAMAPVPLQSAANPFLLTNANPFVVRRQKHRVRDNPKLDTR